MKTAISRRAGLAGLAGLGAILLAPLVVGALSWVWTPTSGEQAPEQATAQEGVELREESAATALKLDAIQRDLAEIREDLACIKLLLDLKRTEPWEDGEVAP